MRKLLGLGTFSTSTVVPHDVMIPIDKSVPLAQAALIGLRGDDRGRRGD